MIVDMGAVVGRTREKKADFVPLLWFLLWLLGGSLEASQDRGPRSCDLRWAVS